MTIIVELTSAEEARLSMEAGQYGLEAADLATRLLRDHLDSDSRTPAEMVQAKLRQWQNETETETFPATSAHELFARWADEDAPKTDDDVGANRRLRRDYQTSTDEERSGAGMKAVFDESAAPNVSAKNAAAIAYLDRRFSEEATDDPDEIRKSEEEIAELMNNLNRNRIENGERPLFP